jgi:uroporphyrinogen-III synthase
MTNEQGPLSGVRILVPRGGSWGSVVAKAIRAQGGTPVVSPLIDFAHTSEEEKLREALTKLQAGYYDWMTATNATVVDVLAHNNAVIAKRTQVAVVGETTYAAFVDAGYEVARTPAGDDNTNKGLLESWPEIQTGERLKILTMRSDVAKPELTEGLIQRGHDVTQVVAYRTVGVPASVHLREDVESGHINALVVSSPQVAREVAQQFPHRPDDLIVACLSEATAEEAERLQLSSGPNAPQETVEALVETVRNALDPADLRD